MTEELRCIGCGAVIQTEDPEKIGYAPKSSLDKDTIICRRCFRLKHYNEIQDVSLTDDDFLKILNTIGAKKALIVYVVDIFDFDGSWLPGLNRFAGNNPVLLVGNKADLLPKSLKHDKLIKWMRGRSKELGLQAKDAVLVSAEKNTGFDELLDTIDDLRGGEDVYIVGCTNVGKSTLINQIIKRASGESNVVTTSQFPGTTLDKIEIPLADGKLLVDTPGIINHHQMAHFVSGKTLKLMMPKSEIKPLVFQLNEEQTLFFGALARLDYESGGRKSFVVYMSNQLKTHRTKLEKATQLYETQAGEVLAPPTKEEIADLPKLVPYQFQLKEKQDIVFSGLGWVTVPEGNAKVTAWVPEGVNVSIRRSLV
ncbi:ribosome biogenesis GTPase YqeH [Listeria grayi]|uniref:ribosome biogenesis GTPase YqeH n=1 Tax=Listeria grayi TaxID=1641 RepID=UPI0016241088|nr:ribosome biogenesis GTPase YqeH [Listeria grayi]MBC1920675.1 ribosome biogenesis GTPase YqeH [Listeria grayi]